MKWHNKNIKHSRTVQMMNKELDDMYCTVQHNKFTEMQGDQ
jgi:hypothetical protein